MATEAATPGVDSADRCAACGATGLRAHLAVGGEMGAEGLIPTTKEFGTALADIARCPACGHMQLDRFPSEAELDAAYGIAESDAYVEEEAGQRYSFASVLERIERYAPGRSAILDVGCWVGFLLAEASGRGWDEAIGIEPSTFASSYAREQLGLDVRTEDLFTADLPLGHFDCVVMGDVLEHLTRANAALERVGELLRPGGVVALELPDAGSRVARLLGARWWSVIPTHVHYFTRESAATMLRRNGYEPLYVATDPKSFTVRYYLDKGGGYLPAVSKALIAAAESLGVADEMWTPDFRDRMLVVARRPGRSGGRSVKLSRNRRPKARIRARRDPLPAEVSQHLRLALGALVVERVDVLDVDQLVAAVLDRRGERLAGRVGAQHPVDPWTDVGDVVLEPLAEQRLDPPSLAEQADAGAVRGVLDDRDRLAGALVAVVEVPVREREEADGEENCGDARRGGAGARAGAGEQLAASPKPPRRDEDDRSHGEGGKAGVTVGQIESATDRVEDGEREQGLEHRSGAAEPAQRPGDCGSGGEQRRDDVARVDPGVGRRAVRADGGVRRDDVGERDQRRGAEQRHDPARPTPSG